MENVTFSNSLEIVTWGLFSAIAALFSVGSFLLQGTLGEAQDGNKTGEMRAGHLFLRLTCSRPLLGLSTSGHRGPVHLRE